MENTDKRLWGRKKCQKECEEVKMMKTKERGKKDTSGLCCGWKFALRNKASTGTAVEFRSSPVHLCTVTSPCCKSR